MSDFPYVGPPPGGLEAAMTTARRRRLRTAGTTSGLSAMSLLVVALLIGQTGRTTLVQGPHKEVPAVTTDQRPVAKDRHTQVSVSVEATTTVSGGTVQAGTTISPTDPSHTAPVAPAVAGPTTGHEGNTAARGTAYAAGPITRADTSYSVIPCGIGSNDTTATVCTTSTENDNGPTTAPHQLYADVCSTDPNPYFLHYAGTSEVDFSVLDPKGREVWRWSRWHPLGPTAHTLTLQTGKCISWTFDWTGVDANGVSLPKGDGYRLKVRFHADELAHNPVPDYAFTLT